jgi:chromosome partitioning protein
MRVISVANQKGGVGKTTTAVNLAFGLAKAGKSTLLLDMDPQANTTLAVVGMSEPEETIYHVLIHDLPLSQVILSSSQDNLSLVPSDIDLAGAEAELIGQIGGQSLLRNKLRSGLDRDYDYIIIDTPPSLGVLTINALAASREILIPVSASFFALKGLTQLEMIIAKVRDRLDAGDLDISGVLVTLYDYTNVAKDVYAFLKQRYGPKAFETMIPKNIKVEEAHSRSRNVYDYAPRSKGALAYAMFVEEVIKRG